MGLDHLLLPLPRGLTVRALLEPYTSDVVEFNFCVKRLNGADPIPPGPVYLDPPDHGPRPPAPAAAARPHRACAARALHERRGRVQLLRQAPERRRSDPAR